MHAMNSERPPDRRAQPAPAASAVLLRPPHGEDHPSAVGGRGRSSDGPGRAAGRRTGSAPCDRPLRTRPRHCRRASRKVVISIIDGQANGRTSPDDARLNDQGRTQEAVVPFSGRADRPKGETVAPQGVSQSPASLAPEAGRGSVWASPPRCSAWSRACTPPGRWTGRIDDVATIARAADALGYDHLTCSEHVVVPTDVATTRGSRYWDPLATFGYLAAVTSRIRLATNVLVLGYHHPLEIAKRYGTLDQVSGGRVILGLGVGSLKEEFELLGRPLRRPGAAGRRCPGGPPGLALRAAPRVRRPLLPVLRRWSWTPAPASPRCRCGSVAAPPAPSVAPSSWATGGCPSGSGPPTWPPCWPRPGPRRPGPAGPVRSRWCCGTGGRSTRSTIPTGPGTIVDRLVAAGATGLQLWFAHHSLAHYLEQLEAMARLVGLPAAGGSR